MEELSIPGVDEVEPMTPDVETRLRELFQLYLDGEVTGAIDRARIETLADVNETTRRIFAEQKKLTETVVEQMEPLRPSASFRARVMASIAGGSGKKTGWRIAVGLLALLVLFAFAYILLTPKETGWRIMEGAISTGGGRELQPERWMKIPETYRVRGLFKGTETLAAAGAVIGNGDRRLTFSRGAEFSVSETDDFAGGFRVELKNKPVRLRIACETKPVELVISGGESGGDAIRVLVPFLEAEQAARKTVVEVFAAEDGTVSVAALSAAARISSPNRREPPSLPEGTCVVIGTGGKALSRRNISAADYRWKPPGTD